MKDNKNKKFKLFTKDFRPLDLIILIVICSLYIFFTILGIYGGYNLDILIILMIPTIFVFVLLTSV